MSREQQILNEQAKYILRAGIPRQQLENTKLLAGGPPATIRVRGVCMEDWRASCLRFAVFVCVACASLANTAILALAGKCPQNNNHNQNYYLLELEYPAHVRWKNRYRLFQSMITGSMFFCLFGLAVVGGSERTRRRCCFYIFSRMVHVSFALLRRLSSHAHGNSAPCPKVNK